MIEKRTRCYWAAALVAVLAVLTLTGCAQEGNGGLEENRSQLPEPEGTYVFYRLTDGWLLGDHGLVSASGEVLLPIEQLYVSQVWDGVIQGRSFPETAAADQFFMTARAERRAGWEENRLTRLYALVSPSGELLTDYLYQDLRRYGDEFGAVKLMEDGQTSRVMLDRKGKEFAVTDLEIWADLALYEYYTAQDGDVGQPFRLHPEGEDVPRDGFSSVAVLEDGRYWGTSAGPGGEQARLYTAEGRLTDAPEYRGVTKLKHGIWAASVWAGGESATQLIRPDGTPLEHAVFDWINSWSAGKYILGRQGNTYYVMDGETGDPVLMVEEGERSVNLEEKNGKQYLIVSDSAVTSEAAARPPYVTDLETNTTVVLEDYPGGRIEEADMERDVYVIYRGGYSFPGLENEDGIEKLETGYALVNGRGEVLAAYGYFRACHDGYFINTCEVTDDHGRQHSVTGLYDSQGNVVLPLEYSRLMPYDGYAFHAEKGGVAGIIDYEGNWLYQETKYMKLED